MSEAINGLAQASPSGRPAGVGPGHFGRALRAALELSGARSPGGRGDPRSRACSSDEHGDWPAGTFLLNPEGFRHAPFSEPGCVLFVKLRQFAGRERRHVAVSYKPIYEQAGFSDSTRLERWESRADLGVVYEQGAELFVLGGEFTDEAGAYRAGCWLRLPVGSRHHPRSAGGCTLYVKRSGLPYLR